MDAQIEQIRDQQKETWNRFSPGWQRWDDFNIGFLQPIGQEILNRLELKGTENLLDVVTGTGEPGLSLARVLKNGSVIGTDLAEGMLGIAEANASKQGLTNFKTCLSDVSELPFDNAVFDAISCRMGFMFFPDMVLAAKEMVRVLKPGGKIAVSVWGLPEKNSWITAMMHIIQQNMKLPADEAGSPGMFRCAEPGYIRRVFESASLANMFEQEINGRVDYGLPGYYWRSMTELAAPVAAALHSANQQQQVKIKKEVYAILGNGHFPERTVLDYSAIVIWGKKQFL